MSKEIEDKESQSKQLPGLTREAEENTLSYVLDIAEKNLQKTKAAVKSLEDEMHELLEVYGEQDKEAMVFWNNAKASMDETWEDLQRCKKARKKPYFGRIDFTDNKLKTNEAYYIGRVGIRKSPTDLVVIDWRAPVATVYYENSLGPCQYTVQGIGDYEIDLTRKRTYEIFDDKLVDFYDSDVVANDDLLTKYLAKSKKAVLGEIIATIQQEQNAIIRKSPRNNILVQGVAGSGKTTVAMHRISYILYNYENEFRPQDFYIIGSNRILLNYITSVLPDLDVYGVSQMTMEQLFIRLLYEDWDKNKYSIKSLEKGDKSACIKGSYAWFHDLEKFCDIYELATIPHEDVIIEKTNRIILSGEEIQTYIKDNPSVSMQNKIYSLNERVLSKLESEMLGKGVSYTKEVRLNLERYYKFYFGRKLWKGSIFELYTQFIEEQREKGLEVESPKLEFDVYDLAALAFIYKRIKEAEQVREASHVVIDEAQDFGMMAYASLKYCLRNCTYTIMGDVSQNIHFGYGLNDWEELKSLVLKDKFDTFGLLKKSYRNTVEISNFATGILRHGHFPIYPVEPIIRHGEEVKIVDCKGEEGLLQHAVETIEKWQREGHETIAVVCRNEEQATQVSNSLKDKVTLIDSDLETTEFGSGVMVLPVEYTKGLEFDAVLLFNPTCKDYPEEDGHVKLLYVAATRALHELVVLHAGDLTGLIAKKAPERVMESLDTAEDSEALHPKKVEGNEGKSGTTRRPYLEKLDGLGERRRTGPKRLVIPAKPKEDKENDVWNGSLGTSTTSTNSPVEPQKVVQKEEKQKEEKAKPVGLRKTFADPRKKISNEDNLVDALDIVNVSPYEFGAVPDNHLLHPAGHTRIDAAVRWIKKNQTNVEIASSYGKLQITPISKEVFHIRFVKGQMAEYENCGLVVNTVPGLKWACKETRDAVGIATEKLLVKVDKKTGVMMFYTRDGKLILSERGKEPRQIEQGKVNQTWCYFDWKKNEKIWARGIVTSELLDMNKKARYISFGKSKLRMPCIVSDSGYGLMINATNTAMCCNIPMYGTYLYTENMPQIDYYFMYGGSAGASLELYKRMTKGNLT